MSNPDLLRGKLFKERAHELFRLLSNKNPFVCTQKELATTFFIGERTIGRYLRYLISNKNIEISYQNNKKIKIIKALGG
jgi:predicted HTH transcriptional regulator